MTLAERYEAVTQDVAAAARDAGRDPDSITTIIVTKFHPPSLVEELYSLGARHMGENRHQEAAAKAAALAALPLTWHFVGQLQGNKAAAALEYASVVHSVDRESLVVAMGKAGTRVGAFIQVNLTDDPQRGGVQPSAVEALAERVLFTDTIDLLGLMAVAPLTGEPRAHFATVREASERLRAIAPHAINLSMGMSGDYREAIAEGATHLRIGTAITGIRPPQS